MVRCMEKMGPATRCEITMVKAMIMTNARAIKMTALEKICCVTKDMVSSEQNGKRPAMQWHKAEMRQNRIAAS